MHRKIYEHHYSSIPKEDECGRPYHIHHIDGNHLNNDPTNLKCVTVQEHFDIHYSQGDWAACIALSSKLSLTREEISKLATEINLQRVKDGIHPFSGETLQRKRIESGTHNFLTNEHKLIVAETQKTKLSSGTHNFQKEIDGKPMYKYAGDLGRETQKLVGSYSNPERRKKHSNRANQEFRDGTHNFIGLNEKLLNEGTHNVLTMHTCPHCLKEIKGPIYFRHHGDNCRSIRKI